jgi:transcriptional regulator with XRE-family HTH domain
MGPSMTFADLQRRLVEHLRRRIQSGETTERGLARIAGISQPHLHNVLKGKRVLSVEMADEILKNLEITVLDLIPSDLLGRSPGRPDTKKMP